MTFRRFTRAVFTDRQRTGLKLVFVAAAIIAIVLAVVALGLAAIAAITLWRGI